MTYASKFKEMSETIVCKGLTKTYGSHVGIAELDLSVSAGEIVGFLGTNGAGKTTTLRCMTGLLRPTSGDVKLLGLDPNTDHNELMTRIGYLPGELRLYEDLTGREHLDFLGVLQCKATPRRAELCERFGLSNRDLDRPIRDFSRGMKQKVGLIQALQHDPDIVLLDEPTEGLDPLVQETFFTVLGELKARGCTIFLSSHVLSEVQRACDRVAIVRGGRLVKVDTVESLRSARSRRLHVTFDAAVDPASIEIDARLVPVWTDHQLLLTVEPREVVDTLRAMLKYAVVDVTVEEAGLDEAVLALYSGGAEDGGAQ